MAADRGSRRRERPRAAFHDCAPSHLLSPRLVGAATVVASRAAVLATLLPADADRETFLRVLGIHGDPVATRRRIDAAKRTKEHLGLNPYGYKRAFSYALSGDDRKWVEITSGRPTKSLSILDPTAGGGSIPLEAGRVGFTAMANELNPVAALILAATIEWPARFGSALIADFSQLTRDFLCRARTQVRRYFPTRSERRSNRGLSLGAHGQMPLLQWTCAVVAELAAGARWHGCSIET